MRLGDLEALAVAGIAVLLCLAVSAGPVQASQPDSLRLYGTWSWIETSGGFTVAGAKETPAACPCERILNLRRDHTYQYVERDFAHEYLLCSGRFTIHPGGAMRADFGWPAHLWVELRHWWQFDESQLIRFLGPDTLLLYPGGADYMVSDAPTTWFVRAAASAPDSAGTHRRRLPLSMRPKRGFEIRLPEEGEFVYYEEPPVPVAKVRPVYSDSTRAAGIKGRVMLHVLVGRDGRVRNIKVIGGITGLNDAAVDAVKKWIFTPALSNNKPIAVWTEVPIDFPPAPE